MLRSTNTLSVGDFAPFFALPDQNETFEVLRDRVGKPSLIIFYANDDIPACRDIALEFRDLMPTFTELDIQLYAISTNLPQSRQAFAKLYNIPFPLLSDFDQSVSREYGICFEADASDRTILHYHRTAFLLDINLRIVKIYSLQDLPDAIAAILSDLKTVQPPEAPRQVAVQAPVLLIPNVCDREICRQLIHLWETEGNEESGFMKKDGEKTIGIVDYSHKIRRDHFIRQEEWLYFLDRAMRRRVFPEIKKAFQFETTRREEYRIGCYDASRGGFFRAHRDDTTPGTAHRRFAMTLNLNAGEYEGGCLRFPEYGSHLYKPDTGSAVIFSCSLMHELTDVTAGRRFVLLSFFYGEKEAQQRIAYESSVQNQSNPQP